MEVSFRFPDSPPMSQFYTSLRCTGRAEGSHGMQRPRRQRSQRRQNQRSPNSSPFRALGAGWMARRLWAGLLCLWTSAEEAPGGRLYQPRQQVCLASHN